MSFRTDNSQKQMRNMNLFYVCSNSASAGVLGSARCIAMRVPHQFCAQPMISATMLQPATSKHQSNVLYSLSRSRNTVDVIGAFIAACAVPRYLPVYIAMHRCHAERLQGLFRRQCSISETSTTTHEASRSAGCDCAHGGDVAMCHGGGGGDVWIQ